ncbi:hypothetical protein QPK32_11445 [Massilia sp. YIM B02763]|uniref:hypothetical protein n=1 Tax=Massilia sp. YIM B02763 TaxID=3050130 RepID=UPI0025B6D4A9|nr:hypothetical protein [Massilia sp. YIM B02763]MDN4053693.1 hypothetical protein [Massilia sp. YIM B02763]
MDRDREEIAQHRQRDANLIVGLSSCQTVVSVGRDEFAAQCRHRIIAEVADQVLAHGVFTALCVRLLGWCYFGQVWLQRFLQSEPAREM